MAKEYRCESCKKYIPADHSTIKVGDNVSFTTTYQTTNSARYSSKTGKVIAIANGVCEIVVKRKATSKILKQLHQTMHQAL
ncbi:hypothetical protein VSN93_17470 [Acinetobacter johnsonii]|uniref:hypothetical protein n=1 Tax=Acinetobacter johnsonii TaxID=40214 RepID=UPI003D168E11